MRAAIFVISSRMLIHVYFRKLLKNSSLIPSSLTRMETLSTPSMLISDPLVSQIWNLLAEAAKNSQFWRNILGIRMALHTAPSSTSKRLSESKGKWICRARVEFTLTMCLIDMASQMLSRKLDMTKLATGIASFCGTVLGRPVSIYICDDKCKVLTIIFTPNQISQARNDRFLISSKNGTDLLHRYSQARLAYRTSRRWDICFNRVLTVLTNSILAPVTGYMFGKGVYFADVRFFFVKHIFPLPKYPILSLDGVESEYSISTQVLSIY